MPSKPILFIGCGGHSRSVADVLLTNDPGAQLLFVDEGARDGEQLFGFDVVRGIDFKEFDRVVVALGDNQRRANAFAALDERQILSVVARNAHISPTSELGVGCFVGNYAHVGPFARLGKNTIVNTGSVVEHEVVVGQHCHIGPNATISGRSRIGDHVFVGVGATVIDGVTLCSDLVIGAGATVVKDISEAGTYVGVPVRKVGGGVCD